MPRFDQSVRIRTHARGGRRPCFFSHFFIHATVRRKSASSAASRLQSRTQAGPMKRCGGMLSVALLGRSFPDTEWIGASKCVPVCSPQEKIVPVPRRAALVVTRHLLDAERPGLAHLRRQRDLRELGGKSLREVDHADSACRQFANETIEDAHGDSSLSSAFGLSRQRGSHSCATSPGYP